MQEATPTDTTAPTRRRRRAAAPPITGSPNVDLIEAPGPQDGMRSVAATAVTFAPGVRVPASAIFYFKPQNDRTLLAKLEDDLCLMLTKAGDLRVAVLTAQPDGTYLEWQDGIESPRAAMRYEIVWPIVWTKMR